MTPPTYDELKASEEIHRLTVENILDPIFITDDEGKFAFICPNVKDLLGYTVEEIESMGSIHNLLGDTLFDLDRLTRQEKIQNVETEVIDKFGKKHVYAVNLKRVAIGDGTILYVCRDITERKRAERVMERMRDRLESLWDIARMADADIQTICDYVLSAVQKMTGSSYAFYGFMSKDEKEMIIHAWSHETMADCRVSDQPVHFPIDAAGIWADALRKRGTIRLNDFQSDQIGKKGVPDGHVILTRLMVVPVVVNTSVVSIAAVANKTDPYTEEDEEQLQAFLSNVQIVFDRKKAQEEALELTQRLEHVQKMEAIGTLAGGVAHDFNNILTPILVQTELTKMALAPDHPVQENLDEVLKAGHRAKDLVKHILAFSRQEKQNRTSFDIATTVKEVLKLMRATIPSSIEIVQEIASEPATVVGDPTGMYEVLMNLCSNAAQAMTEMGSVLKVELREVELGDDFLKELPGLDAGEYIRCSVSDTGHGIPPDIIGKIFDPYFTTKDVGKGTGMGLAVAHGIVKEHGGGITVYSEPNQGTTFHVYLPKAKGASSEYGMARKNLETGTERILFVDDEASIIASGSKMFEQLGYRVRSTTNPVEALSVFQEDPGRFDLVVTDVTMPKMTGDLLAQEMMNIRPDIPIILCTGFSHRIDEDDAKAIGVKGWIMKPFILRETAETIRKVLDETQRSKS